MGGVVETQRLQKYLADAGVASRRKSEIIIAEGRVAVNGQTVTLPGTKIDPSKDVVLLDGKPLDSACTLTYIMLHKPEGFVTTLSDPQGRPVVMDLLRKNLKADVSSVHPQKNGKFDASASINITAALPENLRLFPVGRLDYDSSGLLLLTNDGALAQALTHPRHAVRKKYAARLQGVPDQAALRSFRAGIILDGRRTARCGITVTRAINGKDAKDAFTLAYITLSEGRNRQVRKMCEAIGHPVLSLKRVAVGPLQLGKLPRGAWRYLTEAEKESLFRVCRYDE
jgi:23S rRNA pseudouridine2605 synthase